MAKRPTDFKPGDTITATRLNQIRDYGIKSLRVGAGLVLHITPSGHATISMPQAIQPRVSSPSKILRAVVDGEENDYLTCRPYDGETYGDSVNVAKPWKLRHDATHYPDVTSLVTVDSGTVTVTIDGEEETWTLPTQLAFEAGNEIYIAQIPRTGVFADGEELKWIDLNVDGRAWILSE